MKLDVGKEYHYTDLKTKCKLVYISETCSTARLIVYKDAEGYECVGWVEEESLKELPPTAGSNG